MLAFLSLNLGEKEEKKSSLENGFTLRQQTSTELYEMSLSLSPIVVHFRFDILGYYQSSV